MNVVWQVLVLLGGAMVVIALVRAVMPQRRETEPEFRRRRAEWLTVALGLIAAYLIAVTTRALVGEDRPNPFGMVPYLLLCAYLPVAVLILRRVWRRAIRSAREAAEADQPPMTEPLSPRNTALSGEDELPRRW